LAGGWVVGTTGGEKNRGRGPKKKNQKPQEKDQQNKTKERKKNNPGPGGNSTKKPQTRKTTGRKRTITYMYKFYWDLNLQRQGWEK